MMINLTMKHKKVKMSRRKTNQSKRKEMRCKKVRIRMLNKGSLNIDKCINNNKNEIQTNQYNQSIGLNPPVNFIELN